MTLELTDDNFSIYYNFIVHSWWALKHSTESIPHFTKRFFHCTIEYNFEQTQPTHLHFTEEKYMTWFLLQCTTKWSEADQEFYYSPHTNRP